MKKIFTLILFILLIITTTIIPINTIAFRNNTESIFNQANAEEVAKLTKTIVLKQLDNANNLYTFALSSEQNISDEDLRDLSFKAILKNKSGETQTLSLADFNYRIDKSDKQVVYHILSLKNQELDNKANLSYDVNYGPESLNTAPIEVETFQFAKGLKSNGKMANQVTTGLIPIYYTTNEKDLNIPVYTSLEVGRNYYRSILLSMRKTPNYLNLKSELRFPKVKNVWQNSGNLKIEINENDLTDFHDQNTAKLALDNLLKSFEAGKDDYAVNNIKLEINGNPNSSNFGGIDVSREYPVYQGAKLFLPYVHQDETTWYPIPLQDHPDFDALAKNIIEIYKNPQSYANGMMTQLIPDDVMLESATIEGKTAHFKFNNKLIEHFENNINATGAFFEGLALTFSSLPYIENYQIYIDDKLVTEIGDAIVYNPVGPPTYYNVDKDYLIK